MPRTTVAGITAGFSERQITLGEVTLNYVEGPDSGLPLLLIPGQMESWQGYKRVLPELSTRFHVFVPDLRGHGKSTRTPGAYSYNICGEDLRAFIRTVIGQPALVGGLSSGGVLALWLAANAPADVLAVIAEDPPIFSSIWPRIADEKFLRRNFEIAIESLGDAPPAERDLTAYFSQWGYPPEGETELRLIPAFIARAMGGLARFTRKLRPTRPYDVPLLPFNMRAGLKFMSEYDTDFSRATIDGDLSRDFSPEDTLKHITAPVLLLWAGATRHETWGILGAIDDNDLACIRDLVADLRVVKIPGGHEIHMIKPREYIDAVTEFVDDLCAAERLPC